MCVISSTVLTDNDVIVTEWATNHDADPSYEGERTRTACFGLIQREWSSVTSLRYNASYLAHPHTHTADIDTGADISTMCSIRIALGRYTVHISHILYPQLSNRFSPFLQASEFVCLRKQSASLSPICLAYRLAARHLLWAIFSHRSLSVTSKGLTMNWLTEPILAMRCP